jgi:hypothetical protein
VNHGSDKISALIGMWGDSIVLAYGGLTQPRHCEERSKRYPGHSTKQNTKVPGVQLKGNNEILVK